MGFQWGSDHGGMLASAACPSQVQTSFNLRERSIKWDETCHLCLDLVFFLVSGMWRAGFFGNVPGSWDFVVWPRWAYSWAGSCCASWKVVWHLGFACLLLKSFCIEYCIVHMQPHLPWPSVVKGSWDDPQLVLFAYPNRLISSPEQSEEWQLFNPLFTLHGRAVFDAGCWIVAVARFEVSTQTLGDLFQSMFSPFFCGFSQVMLGLCGFRFSQFWLNHVG